MIRPGTLCLLVGDHSRAGECCTVTGPLELFHGTHVISGDYWEEMAYPVDLRDAINEWAALPRHLIPIAPPGLHDDEPARTDKPREVSV